MPKTHYLATLKKVRKHSWICPFNRIGTKESVGSILGRDSSFIQVLWKFLFDEIRPTNQNNYNYMLPKHKR